MMWLPVTDATLPASSATNDRTRIASDALLEAGGDEGRLGDEQRHCLALHVRTHQRAVGVVMLKERNQTRRPHSPTAWAKRPCNPPVPGSTSMKSPFRDDTVTSFAGEVALVVHGGFACAMIKDSSRSAVR